MEQFYTITPEDPTTTDAQQLMAELSATLVRVTGASGQASFDIDDMKSPHAVFMVARDTMVQPLARCALSDKIGEVKMKRTRNPRPFFIGPAEEQCGRFDRTAALVLDSPSHEPDPST